MVNTILKKLLMLLTNSVTVSEKTTRAQHRRKVYSANWEVPPMKEYQKTSVNTTL